MASKKCLRLAMVGCGGMAGAHLRGYGSLRAKGVDTFRIAAVCDPVRERAEEFAHRAAGWGDAPEVFEDLGRMLDGARPDCADVATPHFLHHTTAIQCLEAGVHVLVEKPLGVTIRAGKRMIEAAEQSGRILATAEQVRRWLGPRVTRWAIQEGGLIGQPRMFFAQQTHAPQHDPDAGRTKRAYTWRQDKITGGGGMIFDSGVHYADLLLHLLGPVDTVYAFSGNVADWDWPAPDGSFHQATVEDTAVAHLTFESGVTGAWNWSNACPGRQVAFNAYYGSHGSIYSDGGYPNRPEFQRWDGEVTDTETLARQFLESIDDATRERLIPSALYPEPLELLGQHGVDLELYDFLEACRTGQPPELDGWDGLRAQAVTTAIFESSWLGAPVKVAEVFAGKVEGYQQEINERWGL